MILEIVLFIAGLVVGVLFAAYRLKGDKTFTKSLSIVTGGGGGPNEPL